MLWPRILFFEQRLFSAGSHNCTQHKSYRLAGKSTKNMDRCVAQTGPGCNKLPCLVDYSPMLSLYLTKKWRWVFLAGVCKFIKEQLLYYSDEFIVEVWNWGKITQMLKSSTKLSTWTVLQCTRQASAISSVLKSDAGYCTSRLLQKKSKYYVWSNKP